MNDHLVQYASYLNNKIASESFIVKDETNGLSSLVANNFFKKNIDLILVPGYKLVIKLKNVDSKVRIKFISKLCVKIKDCQILKTNSEEVTLFRKSFESMSKSTKKEYREFEQSIKFITNYLENEITYHS